MALKKAELSDEIILRLVEVDGKPAENVQVKFASPVVTAREVNGQELAVGPATISGGALSTSFTAYQPRTFAIRIGVPPTRTPVVQSQPIHLTYDLAVSSNDDTKTVGGFNAKGDAIPAEQLPTNLTFNGVKFILGPAKTGTPNALLAKGQTLNLPTGKFNRVYILAASADGDQTAKFQAGDNAVDLNIQDWGGFIGQWDTRVWKPGQQHNWAFSATNAKWDLTPGARNGQRTQSPKYPDDFDHMAPAFIKRADLAWFVSHHHTADGLNEPYQYSYLFAYAIDLPANAKTLTLPNNDKIRILAVTVANEGNIVRPVQPLYDTLVRSDK